MRKMDRLREHDRLTVTANRRSLQAWLADQQADEIELAVIHPLGPVVLEVTSDAPCLTAKRRQSPSGCR